MKILSPVLFILLLVSFAHSQQKWTKTYGGAFVDQAYCVQQTSDGGYVVIGQTNSFGAGGYDVYLVKTDASGDTLWTRTYGGTADDVGYSVRQTSDGGYLIAGCTASSGAGFDDFYLIKTDFSGNILWTRTYGGGKYDECYSVKQTRDQGYIMVGVTQSFGKGVEDVWLVKTNAYGDTLWTRNYGDTGDDRGYSVQQTSDGGYIVAGWTNSFGAGSYDVYLIKTDSSGDTLWTRTLGGTGDDRGYSVQQTSDGGYIVAGNTTSFGAGVHDVWLIKTDAHGDTIWTRTYGGIHDDLGYSVQQTADGGYIIAGWTNSFGDLNGDVYLVKTNASGETLWTRTYGGTGVDIGYSVQQTSDGGYIVAGWTNSFGAGYFDVYLVKTDSNGKVGIEESGASRQAIVGDLRATPSPFVSFTRIPGHETERFNLYDISGKLVGAYRGDRIGEGLSPAVYFIKLDAQRSMSLRIVKAR